jgi:hypothetical protein
MEAVSLPHARRRRRRPSWKALAAGLLYGFALVAAWNLVDEATSLQATPDAATATPTTAGGPTGPSSTDLALGAIASRSARSVVGVGESAGFVAWTAKALTLVVTARPDGGWVTGPGRHVTVAAGARELDGTLVRTDRRTGLGLVRVRGSVGRPLWQTRVAAPVDPGERLVAVSPGGPEVFAATESRHAAIWGLQGRSTPGAPVFDQAGRLVGVATGSRVVPIGRLCGTIRRC